METPLRAHTATGRCCVPSLPTRNGNLDWAGSPGHPPDCSQPTYKEWKRASASRTAGASTLVPSLPTRNGNCLLHEEVDLGGVCSQPTYKEWKQQYGFVPPYPWRRSQPTYKEWKLAIPIACLPRARPFPAYLQGMETHPMACWNAEALCVPSLPTRNGNASPGAGFQVHTQVPSLPTRNGNAVISRTPGTPLSGSQPTYKEWKPGTSPSDKAGTRVPSLPTRNGNGPRAWLRRV